MPYFYEENWKLAKKLADEAQREYNREYNQRPEAKAKKRKYMREYHQRPEAKAKKRKYMREYHQRPEVKAKERERENIITASDKTLWRIISRLNSSGRIDFLNKVMPSVIAKLEGVK